MGTGAGFSKAARAAASARSQVETRTCTYLADLCACCIVALCSIVKRSRRQIHTALFIVHSLVLIMQAEMGSLCTMSCCFSVCSALLLLPHRRFTSWIPGVIVPSPFRRETLCLLLLLILHRLTHWGCTCMLYRLTHWGCTIVAVLHPSSFILHPSSC